MSGRVIKAIVAKDLREFPRNRYWLLIGPVSMALIILGYWSLPDTFAHEFITVGVHPRELANTAGAGLALAKAGGREKAFAKGVNVVGFEAEEHLRAAVAGELEEEEMANVTVGIAFPADFISAVRTGKKTTVRVCLDVDGGREMDDVICSAVREVTYGLQAAATGEHPLRAFPAGLPDLRTVTLGRDRTGDRVPGEKMRPVIAVMLLVFGALVLAGLVAIEIEHRTVTALLVTPAATGDVLVAKTVTGMILGASHALVFLLATGRYDTNWPLVSVLVLLGAAMMSAVGMIVGAAGRGFATTVFFCMLLVTPLMYPLPTVFLRSSPSLFVKAIPSHGVLEGLLSATVYGRSWGDLAPYLIAALVWDVVLLGVGFVVLRRRVATL